VIGIIFIKQIAIMLGATDAMLGDCVIYGRIALLFNTVFMLQSVFQTFLTTAEKPELGLITTVSAGVTNMVLDALFVGVFRWGVAGAAFATGISECVGGAIPLIYFLRPNSSLLQLVRTRFEARVLIKACTNGSSELMSSISSSFVSMLYNFQLLKFAGEDGVAVYGVLMYIQFIFIAIFIGYTIGTSPIAGYNYGAKNHKELKSLLKKSWLLMLAAGIIMMCLAQVLAYPLAKIFTGYDTNLFEMARHAFRIFSFSFILAGINIFTSSFFTALNNGAISAAVSFLRTLVFQTASVLLLPLIFKLDGIWCANVVAEVFAFIISQTLLFINRKKYHYM
ncbi:MAG: MATE family efflux transporter, partial [Lachnospiraceae bacterium]